jgi:hypothetical protein
MARINRLNAARSFLAGLDGASELRAFCNRERRRLAKSATGYDAIERIFDRLVSAKDAMERLATVPGVPAIAAAELVDPTYNIKVDFPALLSTTTAAADLIVSVVPESGGWNTVSLLNPDYTKTFREFTPGATLPLQVALQSLVDTVVDVVEPVAP